MVYGQQDKANEQTPRGVVILDFQDNLIFEGEVVGQQVMWTWGAEAPPVQMIARLVEAVPDAHVPDPQIENTRLAA